MKTPRRLITGIFAVLGLMLCIPYLFCWQRDMGAKQAKIARSSAGGGLLTLTKAMADATLSNLTNC
jgi:hypothetical protein